MRNHTECPVIDCLSICPVSRRRSSLRSIWTQTEFHFGATSLTDPIHEKRPLLWQRRGHGFPHSSRSDCQAIGRPLDARNGALTFNYLNQCGAVSNESLEMMRRVLTDECTRRMIRRDSIQGEELSRVIMHVFLAGMTDECEQDKVGNPYFDHCQRVAALVVGDEKRTVAFLHDVLEKGSGWTVGRLAQEGFSLRIIEAVVALSRRLGEPDDEFLRRVASNPLARVVKRADLEDNLVQAEQAGLDTSKYLAGLELLQNM